MAERTESVDPDRSEPAASDRPEPTAADATAADTAATGTAAADTTTDATTADATTARVDLPAAEFALADLFEQVPDASVELEPAVANPTDHALLVVDADESDHGTIEAALEADPAIAAVEAFGRESGGLTYRVAWDGCARELLRRATTEGITVVAAWAERGRWSFRLLAPDREPLSRAHEAIEESGYHPECKHIAASDGRRADRSDLTDQQREALVAAFEAGYYEIPRDVSAEELAEQLDISHQALSERFRRAHQHLIGATLRLEN